jgi:hypothetical protein
MSKYFYMHLVRILPPQSCKARQLESAPHKESHVQIYLSPVSQEYKMHKTVETLFVVKAIELFLLK